MKTSVERLDIPILESVASRTNFRVDSDEYEVESTIRIAGPSMPFTGEDPGRVENPDRQGVVYILRYRRVLGNRIFRRKGKGDCRGDVVSLLP